MPDYTLKNIPANLYNRLQAAATEGSHSLNQEILARLTHSFNGGNAKTSLRARWMPETLGSGEAKQLKESELKAAFKRGIAQAQARKQSQTK